MKVFLIIVIALIALLIIYPPAFEFIGQIFIKIGEGIIALVKITKIISVFG